MNKTTFVTVWLLLVAMLNFAQEKHSRIRINNPDQATIDIIASAGIDLRCGGIHDHNSLTLELSDSEVNSLKNNNIIYQVEIDDLSKFYAERAERDMPKAQEELRKEKLKSKKQQTDTSSHLSRSITSTTVDSYLQYNEEQEVDWTTPTNFNIPTTFGGCLTVSETEAELDAMRAAYPNLISLRTDASPTNQKTYGFTGSNGWAGQTVYYVKISDNPDGADDPNEPDILYTSMIHSRELSSLMGNIYFMWYILENYATDSAIKHLVDNNELFFVPIVNPDGLRWNEKENPNGGGMNRTNLRASNTTTTPNSSYQENYGVDPNRNFDYLWGSAGDPSGSSGTYTSSTYRGPSAFSEPESQIMRDFILARNFKTAVWQHSYANGIPHPYGGIPTQVSGREDEMAHWHEDMTRYNRYIYGANVLSPANGIADDWMLGGTADGNGSVGSGMNILATTPENGANDGSEGGFWPSPTLIVPIAKRMVRINLMNAYYGGKYAKLHDLTQSNLSGTTADLDFGIERIGQTESDFTITITPISSNITGVTQAGTETAMAVLEQRTVTAQLQLAGGISANEKIEYKVTLNNNDGIIYEANFVKYYNPSILLSDNPDSDNLSNWTSSGDWATTSDSWSGTTAIRFGTSSPYGINKNRTLTTTSSYDLSGSDKTIIQFYSKWDMERNFDFVEFQGSTDGTNWVSLKGVYNKPESSSFTNSARSSYSSTKNSYFTFQSNSLGYIYDGDLMDNWVMEEIIIDDNDNSSLLNAANAQFRFVFRSDGNNSIENYSTTLDGFYFDDFKIIGVQIPCDETNPPTGLTVDSTTPASALLSWDAIPSATYDIRYREVGSVSWIEVTDISTDAYNITGLSENTNYEVQVATRCISSTSSYSTSSNFTTATSVPCTGTTISSFPYSENFDSGIGDWTQGANDIVGTNYEDWTLNSGGTVSSGTGPTDDFTGGGYYLYTEASNANATTNIGQNATVTLISPCFDLTGYENASFSFYYHMVGTAIGSISVEVSTDNGTTWNQLDAAGNVVTNTPILSGQQQLNQTDPWLQQTINLSNYDGQVIKLRFSGTTGSTWSSDSAIDNLNLSADYFNGLVYESNTWTPSAPDGTTGAINALVLDGNYTITSDVEINDIDINSGGSMTISKTGSLIVNGDLIGNNNIVLESDSDEYASLIVSGNIIGDVEYKRHVNNNAGGNDLISAPVTGQIFTDFVANNSNIMANGTNTLYLFGPFDKTTGTYITYSNTESSTLNAGMGYRAASTDNGTFSFKGTVNTGNVNVNIENSGPLYEEWNLIGNPYPSYLNLFAFLAANNIKFDSQKTGVYGYDGSASDGWTIWNQAFADAYPNTIITPGQGFFVASKPGGDTVTFAPGMRTTGSDDDFILGRSSNTTSEISHLKLKLEASGQQYFTDFYFTDNASQGLDPGYDAGVFGGSAPEFAIYSQLVDENTGVDMAIQSVSNADLDNNIIIPLGINADQGQQLTVSIDSSTLDPSVDVFIEDNVAIQNVLLNDADYVFTPSTQLSGTGRFFLRFESGTLSNPNNEIDQLQIFNTSDPDILHIKGFLKEEAQLTVFDIQGRKVLNKELVSDVNWQQIDISDFGFGIYIVEIKNDSKIKTKKIIKL